MRVRGIAAVALTVTACAAVTGLGDYEISDDATEAGAEAAAASDTGTDTGSVVVPMVDGATPSDARSDREIADSASSDGAIVDGGLLDAGDSSDRTDSGDSGVIVLDASREGIRCTSSLNCAAGKTCCLVASPTEPSVFAAACTSSAACSAATNSRAIECDDDNECSGKGAQDHCCIELDAKGPKKATCQASCSGSATNQHACIVTASTCFNVQTCQDPTVSLGAGTLPLLKTCR